MSQFIHFYAIRIFSFKKADKCRVVLVSVQPQTHSTRPTTSPPLPLPPILFDWHLQILADHWNMLRRRLLESCVWCIANHWNPFTNTSIHINLTLYLNSVANRISLTMIPLAHDSEGSHLASASVGPSGSARVQGGLSRPVSTVRG